MLTFDIEKTLQHGIVVPQSTQFSISPSVVPDRFNTTSAPVGGAIVRRELVSTTGERLASEVAAPCEPAIR